MPLPVLLAFALFFFMIGACIGSFLNVVIWRLPHRGHEVMYLEKKGKLTLSWPPSHCPVCDAPIHWYQNIPMLSYLALKGRCANCKVSIPIRYPLVELATAGLWLGLYLGYFAGEWQAHVYPWQNGIGLLDIRTDWPPYVLHGIFASALLAASAIDADFFIIPLEIPWLLVIVGVLAAAFIGPPFTAHAYAVIPSIAGHWVLAKPIAGTFVGLILANILMALKLMPRSFDDMGRETLPESAEARGAKSSKGFAADPSEKAERAKKNPSETAQEPLAPPPKLTRYGPAVAAALILLAISAVCWVATPSKTASAVTVVAGIFIFLIGVLPRDAGQIDLSDDVMEEISSPRVRGEILKELLFVALPVVCGLIAYYLPFSFPEAPWLGRVLGSVMGLLVGGGIVWVIRIFGSLAFNKEAMGMGDAHLMAGIGAIAGWPLAVLTFFVAGPFLAILWAIVLKFQGKPNVLPYGPWLSVGAILMLLFGNPLICFYMTILGMPC